MQCTLYSETSNTGPNECLVDFGSDLQEHIMYKFTITDLQYKPCHHLIALNKCDCFLHILYNYHKNICAAKQEMGLPI